MSSIGASPFADQQTAPCWLVISHDGRYLFTMNTGSGQLSSYAIALGGRLVLLASTPVSATAGVGAVDIGLSNDGRALYGNESKAASVGEFAVDGGHLTERPGSRVVMPAGATPAGITTGESPTTQQRPEPQAGGIAPGSVPLVVHPRSRIRWALSRRFSRGLVDVLLHSLASSRDVWPVSEDSG